MLNADLICLLTEPAEDGFTNQLLPSFPINLNVSKGSSEHLSEEAF